MRMNLSQSVLGYFNHDNNPDFVLYNGGTRQTAVWYMHNNVYGGGGGSTVEFYRLAGV